MRARLDSGFYGDALLTPGGAGEHHLLVRRAAQHRDRRGCGRIADEYQEFCLDIDDVEIAAFGYQMRGGRRFRRYIVKRIWIEVGEQTTLEGGSYRYWVFVANDHERSATELECKQRHKAVVEAGA